MPVETVLTGSKWQPCKLTSKHAYRLSLAAGSLPPECSSCIPR